LALEKAEARVMAASAKQPTHIQKIANVSLMDGFEYFVSAFDTHSQDFVFAEYGFYSKENGNAFHTVNTNGSVFQRNFSDYNIFHMKYAQKIEKVVGLTYSTNGTESSVFLSYINPVNATKQNIYRFRDTSYQVQVAIDQDNEIAYVFWYPQRLDVIALKNSTYLYSLPLDPDFAQQVLGIEFGMKY